MIKIIFVMYNHETDGVKVSLDDKIHVSFNCQNVMHPFIWTSLLISPILYGLLEKNRGYMLN